MGLNILYSIVINTLFQVFSQCYIENIAQYSVLKPPLSFGFWKNHGIRDIRLCVPLTN